MANLLDEWEKDWQKNTQSLGGGNMLDQWESDAIQSGAISAPQPPPDEGILSNIWKGGKAGVAGSIGGLAGWFGGKNAVTDYTDEVLQENQRSREHDGYDADYFLNGSGFAYDVGNLLGSFASMAPAALLVPGGAPATIASAGARLLGGLGARELARRAAVQAAQKGGGALGNYIRYGLGAGTAESLVEGGSGVSRAVQEGQEGLSPYLTGAEIAAKNWPLLVGSQALEGGILHRGFSRLGGKAGESLAKRAGLAPFRTAPYMAGEGLTESAQEVMQERAQEEAFNEPTGGFLPSDMTENERKALYATFAPAALLGGIGGVRGSMRAKGNEPEGNAPAPYVANWDNGMNGLDTDLFDKWESAPGMTDLTGVRRDVVAALNGLANEYGGKITITGAAEKGVHTEGADGHEGGWKVDIDKNLADSEKFLELAAKYGFAVGDEGDHYDLSANRKGGVGGKQVATPDAFVSDGQQPSGQREGHENAWAIYDVFKADGYSDNAIAGILGRVQQEHNFDTSDVPEHEEEGMHLGGYGMFQWNGGRTTAFLNWAQENGLDPQDATTQARYALFEAKQRGLTPEKMNQLSAEEAADLWTSDWEVGKPGDERKYAGEWLTRLQNGGVAGGTTTSTRAPQAQQEPQIDTYDDVYEQFAKEMSQSSDEETKDFFSGMFTKNDKFVDNEENRRKIDERYGEELKEFADVYRNPSVQTQIDRLIDKAVEAKDYNRVGKLQAARRSGDIQLMQKYLDEARAQEVPQMQGQTVPQVIPQQTPAQNVPQAQPAFPIVQEPAQNAPQPAQQTEQAQPIQIPTQTIETPQNEPVQDTTEADNSMLRNLQTEIEDIKQKYSNGEITPVQAYSALKSQEEIFSRYNDSLGNKAMGMIAQAMNDFRTGSVPSPQTGGNINGNESTENPQTPAPQSENTVNQNQNAEPGQAEAEEVNQPVQQETPQANGFVNNTVTTKKGKQFPGVTWDGRVEKDEWTRRKEIAKQHNGWWDGKSKSFGFRTEQDRENFLQAVNAPIEGTSTTASQPVQQTEQEKPKKESKALSQLKKNVAKVVSDYRKDKITYEDAFHKVVSMQESAERVAPDQATKDEIQDVARGALMELESIYNEKNGHEFGETPAQTAQESAGEQEATTQAEEPTQEGKPAQSEAEPAPNEGGEKSAQKANIQDLIFDVVPKNERGLSNGDTALRKAAELGYKVVDGENAIESPEGKRYYLNKKGVDHFQKAQNHVALSRAQKEREENMKDPEKRGAMGLLQNMLGASENAKNKHERASKAAKIVMELLKKSGVEVVTDKEQLRKMGIGVSAAKDGSLFGKLAGASQDGKKIYIDIDRLDEMLQTEIPIHEYTHIWDTVIAKLNPELWKRGVELMKQTPEWEAVKRVYLSGGINYVQDENRLATEVHAKLVQDYGNALFIGNGEDNGSNLVQQLKKWAKEYWAKVKSMLAPWTTDEAKAMSLEDFINAPLADLISGTNMVETKKESAENAPSKQEKPQDRRSSYVQRLNQALDKTVEKQDIKIIQQEIQDIADDIEKVYAADIRKAATAGIEGVTPDSLATAAWNELDSLKDKMNRRNGLSSNMRRDITLTFRAEEQRLEDRLDDLINSLEKQEKPVKAENNTVKEDNRRIFKDTKTADEEMFEELGINDEELGDVEVQGVDNIDDEIEALEKQFSAELSKLNANPVFNPKVYTLGLKLAMLYTKKGFNTIKKLVAKLNAQFGKDVEPWAESIAETVRTWPKGVPFNEKQVMVISQAIGARYEDGITSLDDVQADMKKKLRGHHAKFAPMIEASYNGISKFFESRKEGMENGEGGKSGQSDGRRTAGESGRNQGTETVSQGTDGRAEDVSERIRSGEGSDKGLAETPSENGEASSETGNTGGLRSSVPGTQGRQEDAASASGLGQSGRKRGSEPVSSSVGRGGRKDSRGAGEGGQRGDGVHAASERANDGKQEAGVGTTDRPEVVNTENYHIEDADALLGGTPKVRFARNKKAIETFLEIQAEKRNPTQEEKDAMAAYTGWGSFAQELFQGTYESPRPKAGWEKESQWLKDTLSKEEWEAARDSTINAHYTAPVVVQAMWDMARKMGFKGGRVLEPSMGVGNFFGLMPKDLKDSSTLFGVEMDTTTGGMAKLLYPKANIKISPYQEVHVADGTYDFIIGNVPFGDIRPADRRYNQFNAVLHDYFFLKGIDELRPGGIMMAITSKGTMDKIDRTVRLELAKKAELVDAYRFPTGAFKNYAGTDVVTDVLVFKKREKPIVDVSKEEWLGTTRHETNVKNHSTGENYTYNVNNFFEKHPDKVLGKIGFGRASGKAPGLAVTMDADNFQSQLDNMAKNVNGTYEEAHYDKNIKYESNNENDRIGTLQEKNGVLYVAQGLDSKPMKASEEWKLIGNPKKEETIAARLQELKDLVKLRKAYNALEDAEKNEAPNLEKLRKELKAIYDEHVAKYCCDKNGNRLMVKYKGYDKDNNKITLQRPMRLEDTNGLKQFGKASEPNYSALCALMRKDGKPAKILTERVMRAQKKDIDNPTVKEALMLQRNQSMRIDVDEIARLAKTSKEAVLKELKDYLFKTPNGEYQVRDQYLSGNVRKKLREAKAALADGDKDMEANIKALEKVMPDDIPYYNINVGFGGTWIDLPYYKDFIASLVGGNANADKINITRNINGAWKVEFADAGYNNTAGATTTYGTSDVKFNRLITHALNHTKPTITTKDENGNTVRDDAAINKAVEQIEKIRETFEDWIWQDEKRKVNLAHDYNEIMNNTATPTYDGSFLDMVGMMLKRGDKPFNLRKHQVNAIYRGLVNGSGIYAHEVGTGKTYTMGGLALESRRFGLAKKPLILAHNANSKTVANEIQEMYPGAKILYISGDSKDVKRDIMRIKNDDWDVVVLPHSKTDKLTLKEETLDAMSADIIAQLEGAAEEAAAEEHIDLAEFDIDDPESVKKIRSQTVKELVKERLKIIETTRKFAYKASDKDAIPFEDLGIDMIIVDESHDYKKPPIVTKMNIKGLQKSTSNMSIQLNFLTQYVQGLNNGKGVHLFTGTPITNTITELYNNMRYVMPDVMKEAGIYNFDDWFNAFAMVTSNVEYSSTGEPENVDRLNSFVNVAELRRMVGQYMDIVFAEDMPEFEPRKTASGKTLADKDLTDEERTYLLDGRDEDAVGRPYMQTINEVIPMNEAQKGVLSMFMKYAETWKNAGKKDRKRIMAEQGPESPLFTENAMHKAAMDIRMYNPNINTEGMDSKEARVIKNVVDIYNRYDNSTQCIMMDMGSSDSTEQIPRDEKGYPLSSATYVDEDGRTRFRKEKVQTYNLHKGIIEGLVKAGIPRNEIAVVTGSTSAKEKAEIAEKVNHSEIRVVIGSSSTLGTGVNMQSNLKAMHHIDAPWMPGDLLQRIGRMLRQGNKWNTVLEYRYITEKLDGRRWQVLSTKNKFIKMFMKADEDLRVLDGDAVDVSDGEGSSDFEETLSKATGDPRYLRKANLENSVKKLERAKNSFVAGIEDAKYKLSRLKGGLLNQYRDGVANLEEMADKYAAYRGAIKKGIEITIDGKTYTDSEEANKAIANAFNKVDKVNAEFKLGEFAGLNLYGIKESGGYGSMRRIRITSTDKTIPGFDSADSVAGVIQKMSGVNNTLKKMQERLENAESDIKTYEKQIKSTFPRENVLTAKRKELNDLLKDLEENPTPPPQWLVEGAPVMSDVMVDGKQGTIEGYKANPDDTFYVKVKLNGQDNTRIYPWQKVMDTQGLPMITAPEGVKESPEYKEEKPNTETEEAQEEKPSNNRKYSTGDKPIVGARKRSMDELKAEVKEAFPGAKTQESGNKLTFTMPNGQKVTVSLQENITVNEQEEAVAKASHGFDQSASVTIEGYAETVGAEGFIALSQASREGTGFHEAYHIAEAMAFTKKELADAKRLISANEEERADAYAKWKLERKKHSNFAKLWQKIADVAAKLAGILGYETKRNIFHLVESGEIYQRDNTARNTSRQYSVNASDNSTSSYKQRVKNFFSKSRAADTPEYRRMLKSMMEEIAGIKIRYGKIDPQMAAVYDSFKKVLRAKSANDWERVLPLFAGATLEKLGVKPNEKLNAYISDWIQTGASNNNSREAEIFQKAMKDNPEVADQLIDLQEAFQRWDKMDAMERGQNIISWQNEEKTSFSDQLGKAYDQFIEELGPIMRLVQKAEKEHGKLRTAINPYEAFRLFRGYKGRAMTMIEGSSKAIDDVMAHWYPNLKWKGFKSIHAILDSIDALHNEKVRKEFETYCLACHVYDIHKANDLTTMEIDHQKKLLEKADGEKKEEIQAKIDRLEKSLMETPLSRTDCGNIIREHGEKYGQAQQDLVNYSNMTLAILKDSGVISEYRYSRILKKWPNYVPMFRVFDDNDKVQFGDSMKAMMGSKRDVIEPLQSIIRNTFEMMRKAEKNKAKCLLAQLARMTDVGNYIEEVNNSKPDDKTTIVFYEDGQKRYLQTDPAVVTAVNGMGLENSNMYRSLLRIPAAFARSAFTVWDPTFIVRNTARDVQDAFVYNKKGTWNPLAMLKDWLQAFLHVWRQDDIYWEWMSSGAAQASAVSVDRNYTQSTLDKMTKTRAQRWKNPKFLFLDTMQKLAELSEASTRIANYERVKKNLSKDGVEHLTNLELAEAAYESRDLMDFARGGKASRVWNSVSVFANPALQGWDKFYRTFKGLASKDKQERKEAMYASARLVLAGMLPALVLTLMNWDKDWWKEIPDWQKDTHWIISPRVRIPKGQDIGVRFFSSLIEKGLDSMYNKNPMTAKRVLKPVWEQIPDVMPTAMMPIIEAASNYSFFKDAPIVPKYQENLPAKLQYSPFSSGFAKFISEQLSDKFDVSLSPRQIDHVLTGLGGNVSRTATGAVDAARGSKQLNTSMEEMPILRGFMMTPYKNSATVDKFYKEYRKQVEGDKAFKATKERMEGYSPAKYKRMSQANKKMSELNKKERKLLDDNRISPERKQELQAGIQRQRIAIAKRAMGVK